jgi:hypothetical protein
VAQVQAASQALQAELASLAAKSGVTAADIASLVADDQSILELDTRIDFGALDLAVSELATAIAGGTSTAQAQTDFAAVFTGMKVSSDTVTRSFAALSKAITDSDVTTADLTTVAADQAAIAKDVEGVSNGGTDPNGDGSGSGGNGGGGTLTTGGGRPYVPLAWEAGRGADRLRVGG